MRCKFVVLTWNINTFTPSLTIFIQPWTWRFFARSHSWFMSVLIETLCRKIFVNVCKISQIKTHINLSACIFMTQNKGCNATFDKDNKLQTQQCMNIIITITIYVSTHRSLMPSRHLLHLNLVHFTFAALVGWLHAW